MNLKVVDISVVIPAYKRVDLLLGSLRSVDAAGRHAADLAVECLIVDDGSQPPLAKELEGRLPPDSPVDFRVIPQANAGSAAARLNGLQQSRGEFVQFLDSDDLIHPHKLKAHVEAMRKSGAELSYCDQATVRSADADGITPSLQTLPVVSTPADLFIGVQTSPHNPVFLRRALVAALADPIVPQSRVFEPAGDTWLFFNCSTQSWRVEKIEGHYAIYVAHEGDRFSFKWERLGIASLGVSLTFALRCPGGDAQKYARGLLGEASLGGYRRLPRGFHPTYERLTLALFQTAPRLKGFASRVGGGKFAILSAIIGASNAARLLRRRQCQPYQTCQTIERSELESLFSKMISHVRDVCGADAVRGRFGI